MKKLSETIRNPGPTAGIETACNQRFMRQYQSDPVCLNQVHILLTAAAEASAGLHEKLWEFSVIQDKNLLGSLSDTARGDVNKEVKVRMPEFPGTPGYDIFYNAGTLIVVYSLVRADFAIADCWLAADNIMLSACKLGLEARVVGLPIPALSSPEWKSRLGVGKDSVAVAPIVVGVPASLM